MKNRRILIRKRKKERAGKAVDSSDFNFSERVGSFDVLIQQGPDGPFIGGSSMREVEEKDDSPLIHGNWKEEPYDDGPLI